MEPTSPKPMGTDDLQETEPFLSVVTVTWNSGDKISPYLESLGGALAACNFPIEVIIVDNASGDGTPDKVAREAPWVVLLRNSSNAGFAEGCNLGMSRARGRYLLLLNPDCEANPGALASMVDWLRDNPRTGAVGCMLLRSDGRPQRSAHSDPSAWSFVFSNSMLSPLLEWPSKLAAKFAGAARRPRRCDWLMGSCIMTRREVWERIGGLDAEYFMYCEDADWCRRVREAGFEVVHLPAVSMIHRHQESARRAPEFTFRRLFRSLVLYSKKRMKARERDSFLRMVELDLHLRIPAYTLQAALQPERAQALAERIGSCRRLIDICRARDPDLFDDPPPGTVPAR